MIRPILLLQMHRVSVRYLTKAICVGLENKMKKIEPRDPLGRRHKGKGSSCFKPFNQKVLTLKEIRIYHKLWTKLHRAAHKFHLENKCKIENQAVWPCSTKFFFESGSVHHYPNGYYIE